MSRSGFTFNNIDSSQFGIYADHKRVLFPSIKSREVQIPGKKGSIDFGTRFSARLVEVACYVAGDEVEDLKDTLSQIRAWLDPSNGERVLIFDNDPDWYYKARYTGQIPLSYFVSGASFTIPFKCSDPFIYSINPTEIEEVVTTSPKVIPIDRTNKLLTVRPEITIINTGASIVEGLTVKGDESHQIEFLEPFLPGDTLVIDLRNPEILLNGENAAGFTIGPLFEIPEGESSITIQDESDSRELDVSISWQECKIF